MCLHMARTNISVNSQQPMRRLANQIAQRESTAEEKIKPSLMANSLRRRTHSALTKLNVSWPLNICTIFSSNGLVLRG